MTSLENLPAPVTGRELVQLDGISKSFPGVRVLDDLSLTLSGGEVHVLFGENGAGKSTLIKIISGVYQPDAGTLRIGGARVRLGSPREALGHGVATVYQELSLVPQLSVAENLVLGRWPRRVSFLDRRRMRREAERLSALVGLDVDVRTPVRRLPRSLQQLVEIAKAVQADARVVIFDEPTASLTDAETERLFEVIRRLRAEGRAIVYITHRMHEIREIGDRVTVLRDGTAITTQSVAEVTEDQLISAMTGRAQTALYPDIAHRPGAQALALEAVTTRTLRNVSITVAAGEVVGIAGLLTSGKSDLGRACVGLERALQGQVVLPDGRSRRRLSPAQALLSGVLYYPADRKVEGLALGRPITENMTLGGLRLGGLTRGPFIRRREEQARAAAAADSLSLRPRNVRAPAWALSGGNQQKVMLARASLRPSRLHVFDDPTVGVDVGARAEVYEIIRGLCERGDAVLLISSDLPEVLNLAHRVYVMQEGRVAAHLAGAEITEQGVLEHFFPSIENQQQEAPTDVH
ncbi:sugar ABC transporter ATP-binding protein [Blastococcus sp. SYSU D00820]